jgi:hypothetical protein
MIRHDNDRAVLRHFRCIRTVETATHTQVPEYSVYQAAGVVDRDGI